MANLSTNWIALLNEGILKLIYEEDISISYFTQMYGYVVNCCTMNNKPIIDEATYWKIENPLGGEDLYKALQNILLSYANTLKAKCKNYVGEDFLDLYMTLWQKYRRSSVMLNKLCTHLNENWIAKEHILQHKNIYQVYQVAVIVWKDVLWQDFATLATTGALKLIDDERNGETSNIPLVTNLVNLYLELGANNNEDQTDVYKNCFEKLYLQNSERYYEQLAVRILVHSNSVTDYLNDIEKISVVEKERAKRYLHKSSFKSLEETLKRVLVLQQLQKFQFKFLEVLDAKKIYSFVAGNSEYFVEFRKGFEQFVLSQGLWALKKCSKSAQNDPEMYVSTILGVYQKYREFILDAFEKDKSFLSALDSACRVFVNNNSITKITNSRKSLELIAKYCNLLLNKSKAYANDIELNNTLDDVAVIINFVHDKDTFAYLYATHLSKRLLHGESIDERIEKLMIYRLRSKCDIQNTLKFKKMLEDMWTSSNLEREFYAHLKSSNESLDNFSVQTLTTFIWPFKPYDTSIRLPNEFDRIIRKFTSFHCEKYPSRKLTWIYHASRGEIVTNAYESSYVWQANIFQVTVLLCYNYQTAWSMSELQDQTQIGMEHLKRVVHILAKASILICADGDNYLTPNSVLALNMKYSSKNQWVNLNIDYKKIDRNDVLENKKIEENRKFVTQAYIVKIMKNHKVLKTDELAAKVLNQVKPQFKLNKKIIDEWIDQLVLKEYLVVEKIQDDVICKYIP